MMLDRRVKNECTVFLLTKTEIALDPHVRRSWIPKKFVRRSFNPIDAALKWLSWISNTVLSCTIGDI